MMQGGPRADPYKWSEIWGPSCNGIINGLLGCLKKYILLIGPITPFINGNSAHLVGYNGFVLFVLYHTKAIWVAHLY